MKATRTLRLSLLSHKPPVACRMSRRPQGLFSFPAMAAIWCLCFVCPAFLVGLGNSFPSAFRLYLLYHQKGGRQNGGNKELKLNGIRRAPRGVPQIEVTFTIDANGIVNVSAMDKDTGKRQEITIQSSGNMSREEIERAVREAQQYAAEDARARADAQVSDRLESLLYRSEEIRKRMDKEQRKQLDEAVKTAKRALRHKDAGEMNAAADALEAVIGTQDTADNAM